jgi:hypothetical protein
MTPLIRVLTVRQGKAESIFLGRDRLRHKAYNTGITSIVSTIEDIMPPIIGAAIRFITSAPVPVVHMIGSKLPMMAATGI